MAAYRCHFFPRLAPFPLPAPTVSRVIESSGAGLHYGSGERNDFIPFEANLEPFLHILAMLYVIAARCKLSAREESGLASQG